MRFFYFQKIRFVIFQYAFLKISGFAEGRYACTESPAGKKTPEMDELDRGKKSLKT